MEAKSNNSKQIIQRRIFLASSLLLGLTGVFLVLYTTAKYGVGVSGDSIDYLSTADNLIRYHKFIDYNNYVYIYWPPFYPLLLAGVSLVTRIDTFLVAGILNAIFFGLIVFLTGIFFYRSFPGYLVWAYLGILISFTSLPILRIASNITSDPLFIVLILLFVILSSNYLSKPNLLKLIILAVIASIAPILRWHGVTLIISIVVLTLYSHRRNLKSALLTSFGVGLISSTPFLLWVLGRNYRLYGVFLGEYNLASVNHLLNIKDSVTKITNWLLPDLITRNITPVSFLIGLILFMIISSRWGGIQKTIGRLSSDQHLPWVIFLTIDYIFVILTNFLYDHPASFDDRYYTPLFPFFLLCLAVVFTETIIKPLAEWHVSQRINTNFTNLILILTVGTWLIFPSYRLYKYIKLSREHGEPTYNLYNTQAFNESEVVEFLLEHKLDEDKPIYSNFSGAVYFFTREITFPSPKSGRQIGDLDYLKTHYQDWPSNGEAYLVWFKPHHWKQYYQPKELSTIAELSPIFTSKDGGIYLVTQR